MALNRRHPPAEADGAGAVDGTAGADRGQQVAAAAVARAADLLGVGRCRMRCQPSIAGEPRLQMRIGVHPGEVVSRGHRIPSLEK
jgi:hypothetical protein